LSPTIYLTDILVFLLLLSGFTNGLYLKEKKNNAGHFFLKGFFFLVYILLNLVFSQNPYVAAFKWLKLFELGLLGYFISRLPLKNFEDWVTRPLCYSLIFFSLIGIAQFISGKTLGGILYLFGERRFNLLTPGIALKEIFGKDFLRAYSTFPHPNSLAGYYFVALLLALSFGFKKIFHHKLKIMTILFSFTSLILSFSTSSFLVIVFIFLSVYLLKKLNINFVKMAKIFIFSAIVFSLILPFISKKALGLMGTNRESIINRLVLAEASGRILVKSPTIGVGLNNFIVLLPYYVSYPRVSWWLQPVHNIFLLLFCETGVIGLFMFLNILSKFFSKLEKHKTVFSEILAMIFVFTILTGTVDHYWFTLQQNLLLLSLIFGLTFNNFWCKVKV